MWSSPALYDVNGDGRLDILIGGDQSPGGAINWSGGEFRAIEWTPGDSVSCSHCHEIWKHQVDDTIMSSGAVGDIDGDGRPEVIVGGGTFYGRAAGKSVFAWHVDDGSSLRGWPALTSGTTLPSPALGDLNGNGVPEVVESSADGYVRAYNGNGSVHVGDASVCLLAGTTGWTHRLTDHRRLQRRRSERRRGRQQLRLLHPERAHRRDHATRRQARVARSGRRGRQTSVRVWAGSSSSRASTLRTSRAACRPSAWRRPR